MAPQVCGLALREGIIVVVADHNRSRVSALDRPQGGPLDVCPAVHEQELRGEGLGRSHEVEVQPGHLRAHEVLVLEPPFSLSQQAEPRRVTRAAPEVLVPGKALDLVAQGLRAPGVRVPRGGRSASLRPPVSSRSSARWHALRALAPDHAVHVVDVAQHDPHDLARTRRPRRSRAGAGRPARRRRPAPAASATAAQHALAAESRHDRRCPRPCLPAARARRGS